MIKLENEQVVGWESAIRGMRNPLNSWKKSDSEFEVLGKEPDDAIMVDWPGDAGSWVGPNDQNLMKRLHDAGTDHRKFMRMLVVYVDITAPLYWWKEFDTYKVGTVANSCSTMHTIHKKKFELDDFSHEHIDFPQSRDVLRDTINALNYYRDLYLNGGEVYTRTREEYIVKPKDKYIWWQMIQLLPSSYNQKRTVMLNYEVLANIYKSRKNHKLDEWHEFCNWAKDLPLADILIVDDEEFSDENIRKFFNKVQKIDSKAFSYSVSRFGGDRKIICIYNSSGELRWGIDSTHEPSLDQAYEHIKDFLEKADEQTRG